MKNTLLPTILAALCALCLAACSGNEQDATVEGDDAQSVSFDQSQQAAPGESAPLTPQSVDQLSVE